MRNCLALLMCLPIAGAAQVWAGERCALVIGINAYRAMDKVTACVAEAEAVAKVLEETGGFSAFHPGRVENLPGRIAFAAPTRRCGRQQHRERDRRAKEAMSWRCVGHQ